MYSLPKVVDGSYRRQRCDGSGVFVDGVTDQVGQLRDVGAADVLVAEEGGQMCSPLSDIERYYNSA